MRKAFLLAILVLAAALAQEGSPDVSGIFLVRSDVPLAGMITLVEKDLTGASGAVAADYMNFLDFPPYMAIGAAASEDLAYSSGVYVASDLSSKGATILYGLRFEAITSKDVSVGTRAFGSDADVVYKLAKSFAKGVRDAGLKCIAVMGSGRPFGQIVESGVDGVIVKDSADIKTLRLAGFKGPIISPLITGDINKGVRDAMLSGYDMIQLRSSDVEMARSAAEAMLVDTGFDLAAALERAGTLMGKGTALSRADSGTPQRLASNAASLVRGNRIPLPTGSNISVITDNDGMISEIKRLRGDVFFYGYDSYESKDYTVLCIEGDRGRLLIPELGSELGDRLIVLSLGFPMDVFYYPEITNYVTVYGNDSHSLRAASEALFGSNPPKGHFPLRAPRTQIMKIDYATEGKTGREVVSGSSAEAIQFNADYSIEKRMARVGVQPGSSGMLVANSTIGATFASPVKDEALNVQFDFRGGMKGIIDNNMTSGSFEVLAGITDLTTGKTYGGQIFYSSATKMDVNQSFSVTVNATLTAGHRYFAYIEARARQDATLLITGKIDFWSGDCGVWYDDITLWV
jgi:hypothetical protein